jgi:hypothetical protein
MGVRIDVKIIRKCYQARSGARDSTGNICGSPLDGPILCLSILYEFGRRSCRQNISTRASRP